MGKYRRRRTQKRAPRRKRRSSGNPLAPRVGGYYKTQYTQLFELTTTNSQLYWAGCTVNLVTLTNEDSDQYISLNKINPNGVQGNTAAIFDQAKITGVRMKVIVPPSAGNLYSYNELATGRANYVPIQPSRIAWAYDPDSQIGNAATPQDLQAKSSYKCVACPEGRTITKYFKTAAMLRSVGLGTGWHTSGDLTYSGQIKPQAGPSVHVRLITSIQGAYSSLPPNFRLGQIEVTYYVTYRGRKSDL